MISPSFVCILFDYRDGKLFWKFRPRDHFHNDSQFKRWYTCFWGTEAGTVDCNGYLMVQISERGRRKKYSIHWLVWAWHYGKWPTDQLDHVDHDRANNRIENLREATNLENGWNRSLGIDNSSGINGVSWYKRLQKWHARIQAFGANTHLGYFDSLEDAVSARKSAEARFGFHPNHGT